MDVNITIQISSSIIIYSAALSRSMVVHYSVSSQSFKGIIVQFTGKGRQMQTYTQYNNES